MQVVLYSPHHDNTILLPTHGTHNQQGNLFDRHCHRTCHLEADDWKQSEMTWRGLESTSVKKWVVVWRWNQHVDMAHTKVMENLEKLAKSPLWIHVTASIKLFLFRSHSGYFLYTPTHLLCNLCLLYSIFHITHDLWPSLLFSLNISFVFLAHWFPSCFVSVHHTYSLLDAHIWNSEARIFRLKRTCGFCHSEPRLHHLEFSSYTFHTFIFLYV